MTVVNNGPGFFRRLREALIRRLARIEAAWKKTPTCGS
jgi:hypothetical protein